LDTSVKFSLAWRAQREETKVPYLMVVPLLPASVVYNQRLEPAVIKLIFAKLLTILDLLQHRDKRLAQIEAKLDTALVLLEAIKQEVIPDPAAKIDIAAGPVVEQPT